MYDAFVRYALEGTVFLLVVNLEISWEVSSEAKFEEVFPETKDFTWKGASKMMVSQVYNFRKNQGAVSFFWKECITIIHRKLNGTLPTDPWLSC